MSTKVVMEALSPTMEEGRLVEWKKQEGDAVAVGDVLAEVETDKAVMELVARAGGTLLKQVVQAGTTVPVSELVAVIGEPGEKVEAPSGGQGDGQAPAAKKPAAKAEAPEAHAPPPADGNGQPASRPAAAPRPTAAQPAAPSAGRVKASPLARRMAAERGIDISGVSGSGPEGRIVARDVEGSRPAAAATAPAGRAPTIRVPAGQPYQDVPLTQIRKTIAKRLVQSIGPIPTFYLTTEVDMERSRDAREALLEAGGEKVSFNDIVIKAVAMALRQHPECNAWWQDDHIR
jgi:pyruvate dehydrogenase E2 component (dihydrolipoamide acetyltransferase)